MRELLSAHVLNGAAVALGMLLITAAIGARWGMTAGANAAVGVTLVLLTDTARARRGKFAQMLAAPLLGLPLFLAVQWLRPHPLELGLLLLPGTFLAFLAMAWGSRGIPVAMAGMFAMLFALAPQPAADLHEALQRTAWCALGAALYLVWGVGVNAALNGRYRAQMTAQLLFSLAALLRTHAARLLDDAPDAGAAATAGTDLLLRHAALSDELQATRDLVLESPRTPRRQRLAGMLILVLEMRDRLIASELDLERVRRGEAGTLPQLAAILCTMAADLERIGDALLLGRTPQPAHDHRAALAQLRVVSFRVAAQDDAVRQLAALARGELAPDLSAVRAGWRLFVSPAYWSVQPLLTLWHWRQPALRHAIRAALAVGSGYLLALALPWVARDYWILITIVVVLRGSLAQTLSRRNDRVLGTLIGSLLATGLLVLEPPLPLLLVVLVLSQGVAHAFAVRRYTVTSVAGSLMGLVMVHLLYAATNPAFALVERVADTLLGAAIAWAFSYVLPSWERQQMRAVVERVCRALAQHARRSLDMATLAEITAQPELAWRLARREAYDALSALGHAWERARFEPGSVQPPLQALERLQAHGYQLLGQLSAVQSLMLLRTERLPAATVGAPIAQAARGIEAALDLKQPPPPIDGTEADASALPGIPEALPDPLEPDASPWLLRRVRLAVALAAAVRADADALVRPRAAQCPGARVDP
ncbi:MAG TPA: FUSC family membrane protein [Rubrivivax sp.]|nr:FUSC family protein [Burkholderiales bacterium]HNT37789.1 FUSC family membrane protein [Rubrivivax sp.]